MSAFRPVSVDGARLVWDGPWRLYGPWWCRPWHWSSDYNPSWRHRRMAAVFIEAPTPGSPS